MQFAYNTLSRRVNALLSSHCRKCTKSLLKCTCKFIFSLSAVDPLTLHVNLPANSHREREARGELWTLIIFPGKWETGKCFIFQPWVRHLKYFEWNITLSPKGKLCGLWCNATQVSWQNILKAPALSIWAVPHQANVLIFFNWFSLPPSLSLDR